MTEIMIDAYLVDKEKRTLSQAYLPQEEVELINSVGGIRGLDRPVKIYCPSIEAGQMLQFSDVWVALVKVKEAA